MNWATLPVGATVVATVRRTELRRQSGSAGFTLIEIVIVLLLASLIVGLISPVIISSVERSSINRVGGDLLATVRSTRAKALISNKEQRIFFDLEQKLYYAAHNSDKKSIPKSLEMKLLTAESELESSTVGSIRFFPDGSSTGGRITLSNEKKSWSVNVTWLTGDIQLTRQVLSDTP